MVAVPRRLKETGSGKLYCIPNHLLEGRSVIGKKRLRYLNRAWETVIEKIIQNSLWSFARSRAVCTTFKLGVIPPKLYHYSHVLSVRVLSQLPVGI